MRRQNEIPVIGIIPQLDVTSPFRHVRLFPQYMKMLDSLGAAGIMLPFTKEDAVMDRLIELCDGFIFTGGQDIHPGCYHETMIRESEYAPERDEFEAFAFPKIIASRKPILAICRGMQMINILYGGTIRQDLSYLGMDSTEANAKLADCIKKQGEEAAYSCINKKKEHDDFVLHADWNRPEEAVHDVNLVKGTKLAAMSGATRIGVNSLHHQGIETLGKGLKAAGITPDGRIEAIEIDGHPFAIGVQWHPEVLGTEDAFSKELFEQFLDECRKQENPEEEA